MGKINQDDIAAITARMDAFAVIMIELMAELSGRGVDYYSDKYTERYDNLAAEYRKNMVSKSEDKS